MTFTIGLTFIVIVNDVMDGSFLDRSCSAPPATTRCAAPVIVGHVHHLSLALPLALHPPEKMFGTKKSYIF